MIEEAQLWEEPIGVLNEDQIYKLRGEIIENFNIDSVDGSAFDLHISDDCWGVSTTTKLALSESVEKDITCRGTIIKPNEDGTFILEKSHVYIFKLEEKLHFSKFESSEGLYARASGKSSIGRLDVLTRLIVDNWPRYDEVPPSYSGNLYLEIIPISFSIKIPKNFPIHQLRIFKGDPDLSIIREEELNKFAPMLYYSNHEPVEPRDGILSLNLEKDGKYNAFRAKNNRIDKVDLPVLDLTINTKNEEFKHEPEVYWVGVEDDSPLQMETDSFYILRSRERLFLPNDVAVSCVAYTENLGELRIHYAGFAHPNFGRRRKDGVLGAPLIFEARCHNFQVLLKNEEHFAKIEFYKMSRPSKKTSNYTGQELKLSNYFKEMK